MLEAVRRLPSDVVLWVAGEGPQTAGLRRAAGGDGRVQWLGRLNEAEKLSRLRGADVFCAPSLSGESFGLVLLEAMAAETAIVATDIPGYSRVVRSDIEAVLVPPEDPDRLAAGLLRALEDPGDLVARGIARAEQFSMDGLAGCYENIYERLLT